MLTPKIPLKLLKLDNTSIYDQLCLEEYLLRDTESNYCILNSGSPSAIVMGISGKMEELIELEEAEKLQIPIIKRFSGGGTVAIDSNTLFITFIFNTEQIQVPGFPEAIYRYTTSIYEKVFEGLPFSFRQNDYVLNDQKIGGNAQYIKKNRWLHHTSFLWDYDPKLMSCLKHPKKMPTYRENRTHQDFVTCLKHYVPEKTFLFRRLLILLEKDYETSIIELPDAIEASRLSTELVRCPFNVP